jgi:UDP:flavonoid glycosyltransferase YjiC (YdhE family)
VALGLGRALSPDASPVEIGNTIMDMLGDRTMRDSSRSFARGVSRFGDLARAADLIEAHGFVA